MEAWTDPAAIDDPAYQRGVTLAVYVMASGRPPRAFRVGAVGVEGKANDAHLRLKQCNDENTTAWVAERAPWRYLVLVPMRGADPEAVRAARDELLGSLRGIARAVQPRGGEGSRATIRSGSAPRRCGSWGSSRAATTCRSARCHRVRPSVAGAKNRWRAGVPPAASGTPGWIRRASRKLGHSHFVVESILSNPDRRVTRPYGN